MKYRFDQDERRKIAAAYATGLPATEVARRYDCGRALVVRCAREFGCHRGKVSDPRTPVIAIVAYYRAKAQEREIPFNLSLEQVEGLINHPCYYCESPPNNKRTTKYWELVYSGIDRIDSDRGYETTNVVPCCIICNKAKNDLGLGDFVRWLGKASTMRLNAMLLQAREDRTASKWVTPTHPGNNVVYGS